jgi:hypothetical protein
MKDRKKLQDILDAIEAYSVSSYEQFLAVLMRN